MNCPVCGHVDGACKGNTRTNARQIITSDGVTTQVGLPRVPMNRSKIGRAGYVGPVDLYDPKVPNVRFVSGEEDERPDDADPGEQISGHVSMVPPAVEVKPKRTRKKKADQ